MTGEAVIVSMYVYSFSNMATRASPGAWSVYKRWEVTLEGLVMLFSSQASLSSKHHSP